MSHAKHFRVLFFPQLVDVANPHPSWRVRLLVRARAVPVRRASRRPEDSAPQVQLLHVRVRFGHGPVGVAGAVLAAHRAHMLARFGRPSHRRERHRHRMGSVERGGHSAVGAARGKA